MAGEMSVKGVLWLTGFHFACWIACHLTLALLFWSFPITLVAFYFRPRETRELLYVYIIPFLKKVLDYIHSQIDSGP